MLPSTLVIISILALDIQYSSGTSQYKTLLRLRLKAFHFESLKMIENQIRHAYDAPDEGSQHLARLMRDDTTHKTAMGLGLDLTFRYSIYDRKLITPKIMIDKICNEIGQAQSKINPITNTFLLINDDTDYSERVIADKGLTYFMYLASMMNVPVLTWFPDRVGQLENTDHSITLRLEPTNWHVAHAIADFLQAYSWTAISVVTSNALPDRRNFIKELHNIQKQIANIEDPKYFPFSINRVHYFHGLDLKDIGTCARKRSNCATIRSLKGVLEKLWKFDIRIFIFHGSKADLIMMLTAVKLYAIGPDSYLLKLFGEGYLWICTPAFDSPIETIKRSVPISSDSITIQNSFLDTTKSVSGMFFLSSLNHFTTYKKMAEFSRILWQKSMLTFVKVLQNHFHNDSSKVQEALLPKSCHWKYGYKLYQIMKATSFKFNDEYYGFTHSGAINTTEMFIFNSKAMTRSMKWFKVGTWSMSSKWGKRKSRLRIDGVTWPGNNNKPPKGRPDKFLLKVATIKEMPFVFYGKIQENGKCDANAIPCRVRRESLESDDEAQEVEEPSRKKMMQQQFNQTGTEGDEGSSYLMKDIPDYRQACCAGLTIDLLHELMKDLNFNVDLFEVPDGKWGGWTPEGWNGLVKVLKDQKADMVMTSFKITTNRSGQIDFSVPFMETGIAIIVALKKGAISPKAFLEPYDYSSWCVILVFSVHACGAALFIYEWVSPNGLDRGAITPPEHKFSLFRSLWLIWSMLFGAAVNADNPRGVASRFLANIWALFALVFLASYTANLAAFMIAKDDFYNLKGIRDERLMYPKSYKPTFRFATVPSGATEENIKINFPLMYNYMKNFNKSSIDDGIKALKNGDIDAFVYDSNVLDYKAARDKKCKLKTVGNLYAMTGYGVGFPKESLWRDKVNKLILHYQRYGKLQRWKRFWMTGQCKKERTLDSTNKTLGVTNFISAFILLLGGMVLSALILCLEHIFYRYIRPHVRHFDTYECCGLVSLSMGQLMSVNQAVNAFSRHSCSESSCRVNQWKMKEENIMLKNKLKKTEAQLSILTKSLHLNIPKEKSHFHAPNLYNPPSYSTTIEDISHNDYSNVHLYNCHRPNISYQQNKILCPIHKSQPHNIDQIVSSFNNSPSSTHHVSRPVSLIEKDFNPKYQPNNISDLPSLIPNSVNTYKIIKSNINNPNSPTKDGNGTLVSSILKIKKRRHRRKENVVKESCL